MPPLIPFPFPLPMRLGTDICSIPRISRLLSGPHASRFIKRILRPDEYRSSPVSYLLLPSPSSSNPSEVTFERACSFMAGRFAAKEATIKAHSWWELGFQDIEIRKEGDGRPVAAVWPDGTGDGKGKGRRAQEALVTISHDGDWASAVCLGWDHGQREVGFEQGKGDGGI